MLAAMFKEIVSNLDLGDLKVAGLVLFVGVFLGVLFFALTRSKAQAQRWAEIPLEGSGAGRAFSGVEESDHV